jgi:Skp family chaperone for outer membrane proteins
MNAKRFALALTLMAGLALVGWLALSVRAQPKDAPAAKPTKVAVADVEEIFTRVQERTRLNADMTTMAQRVQEDDKTMQRALTDIQDKVKLLKIDSPEYVKALEDLEQGSLHLKAWRDWQIKKLNAEKARQMERLYKRLLETVGKVATSNGLDLVLFKETAVDFAGMNPDALPTQIQVRKVLWSADSLDITSQVIQVMDNDYKNRMGTTTQPK